VPTNRWTSYESTTETDWLEIDFGDPIEFRRVDVAIYDDGGGVQVPSVYPIEIWTGEGWKAVDVVDRSPEKPAGSPWNSATFEPVVSLRLRIVFAHSGRARSGVTEVMIWNASD
jgi:hypothetical protein